MYTGCHGDVQQCRAVTSAIFYGCLFVCEQNNSKSYAWVFRVIWGV